MKQQVQQRVAAECHSLISEGYHIIVNVSLPKSVFVRLRHRGNGNYMSVIGNFEAGTVRLFKNGRTVNTIKV